MRSQRASSKVRVHNRKDGDIEYLRVYTAPYVPGQPVYIRPSAFKDWERGHVREITRTECIADRQYRVRISTESSTYIAYCDEYGHGVGVSPVREESGILSPV